jgi:uncharacterized membrane protein YcfT
VPELYILEAMMQEKPAIDLFLVVQSVIVLLFVATVCYLFAAQQAIPDLLQVITTAIVAVYVTSRQQASIIRQQAYAVQQMVKAVGG